MIPLLGYRNGHKSALYLDGTTIDFYEGLEARGFKFDNPNAVKSCHFDPGRYKTGFISLRVQQSERREIRRNLVRSDSRTFARTVEWSIETS